MHKRLPAVVLALILALVHSAVLAHGALAAQEQATSTPQPGGYLAQAVTPVSPLTGEDLALDAVSAFSPGGGWAVFEPDTIRQEYFRYGGTDGSANHLTGLTRFTPLAHDGGTFVAVSGPPQSPSPSPSPSPTPSPKPSDPGKATGGKNNDGTSHGPSRGKAKKSNEKRKGKNGSKSSDSGRVSASIQGRYSTEKLTAAATYLRGLGWKRNEAFIEVSAPFIIAGPAAWSNTWGAPRTGPGPIVRRHEGQDVFCRYGDPVLAVHNGAIEFDEGGLGGKIARLYKKNGAYWYYAHLSGFPKNLESGDRVRVGDVIGYCGNTGNAITTPPHVHFGFYDKNGKAQNPMWDLVRWLRQAERRVTRVLAGADKARAKQIDRLRLARLFGDAYAPDLSEVDAPSPEALLGAGSDPSGGMVSLAETAVGQAIVEAADRQGIEQLDVPEPDAPPAPAPSPGFIPDRLTELLSDG